MTGRYNADYEVTVCFVQDEVHLMKTPLTEKDTFQMKEIEEELIETKHRKEQAPFRLR